MFTNLPFSFGMEHDGTKNDCGINYGEPAKIMAGKAMASGNPFQWSRCSRKYITDYLELVYLKSKFIFFDKKN